MVVGYYILPIDAFHAAVQENPFHACAHQIDDTHVICWARFRDHGQEQQFRVRDGVEALPDARSTRAIDDYHVGKLKKYGVQKGETTMEVSEHLVELAGDCMKLPSA